MTTLEHFLGQPRVEAEPGIIGQHLGHLSASSIGMLLRCPRQFQRRYLFGEKERPGEGMVVGDFFHETMEWNYGQKIESHVDQPLSDAIQYLHDVSIPKVLEENGGVEEIEWTTTAEIAQHDAERITSAYYKAVVPRIQPVSVESKFSIGFDGLEVPVIGYIDTEDADRILDTKTGKSAVKKLKPSWNLQGRLYTYAREKPTEFHSISRAQSPTIVTALESDQMTVQLLSETQVKEMRYLIGTAAELLRHFLTHLGTEQDWPTWGSVPDWTRNILPCDRCGWRKGCPAWS